ncbi:hypothetical protein ALC56_06689 [Trachymyrmex septentrionalis]|uniref:Uncharacterized protein n=1 Tax=Trachymyrmex septentrionalis TaxID=34720 RepID=A0A151JWP3_9HYME|nr:hypothetical protein ALC56_06689 [Trachymyrmex septentrionalis]
MLENRYDDKRLIIQKHVKTLFELPPLDRASVKLPQNLRLTDPTFHQSTHIDLIGAEIFWNILYVGQIKESSTAEERECEEHFKETHYRNIQSRFVVEIPLKQDAAQSLGNSYDIALERFYSLERKLSKNPQLKEQYTQFINKYQTLDHMGLVDANMQDANLTCYLPHHAVVKSSSTPVITTAKIFMLSSWIKSCSRRWTTCVTNRVCTIQELPNPDGSLGVLELETAIQRQECSSNSLRTRIEKSLTQQFLDQAGFIRVEERHSNLGYSSKHQLVSLSKHPFTRLMIECSTFQTPMLVSYLNLYCILLRLIINIYNNNSTIIIYTCTLILSYPTLTHLSLSLSLSLSRIHEVHQEDIIWVVTIKTSKEFFKRPADRICLFPIKEDSES